jgi:oligogalacturonide lyase
MNQIKLLTTTAIAVSLLSVTNVTAQELMETGGKEMPNEWIDKDTHHKVVKITRTEGSNSSFYFHNNPFIGNKMVYYNSGRGGRQAYTVDLKTLQTEKVTSQGGRINGEIAGAQTGNIYYQTGDSVYSTNINTKQTKLLFVFPADFKASITTINADETLLGGAWATDEEKEISKKYPEKHDYFNRIYESKLKRTLFVIDIKKKELVKVFSDTAWLNHVQFSPKDPSLLMFCHEGPWHKVDRIWTINVNTKEVKLMHKRTMDMEIAGHEWFQPDGKIIWYDLQMPRSENFFVGGTNVKTGEEQKYRLTRDEWSIHFTISHDQQLFAGDGGNEGQVAKAKDGMWIYLFTPEGDHFKSTRLVNMKNHDYKLEPNVHFSPDNKWIIFRANFEGIQNVYAVEIAETK